MNFEKKSSGKMIVGILLILFGSLLFLSNLEIISGIKHIVFSWPVVLLVIGLVFFVTHKNSHTGIILMVIGSIGLIAKLNHSSFHYVFHEYWPAFLIVLGIYILFKKDKHQLKNSNK